ncbi:deoxyribose-phosphate aldolase [Puniceicoccales bacterium CK1056]|uniref:Deoxyribose-phosphate aldolase n=1 Tax=Oceanipulchritudo coccoides TaxID=2706888 RepID=A0A6B2M4G2_9BACT|nr:deoxyribose-phosphate aldolase [Oceanipulchritudo coccoides]NDV62725.1 deoxyribose-phosphate aldolase [Oceanipulchritudo coccoides]
MPRSEIQLKVPIDAVGVAERTKRFQSRSIKKESKMGALKLALSMVDLTTLEGSDTPGKVRQLCRKALLPDPSDPTLPRVAAICVYPTMVPAAYEVLKGTGVHLASVATAFPSGHAPMELRLEEVRYCVEQGADEIDMVISRGAFLAGDNDRLSSEVAAFKEACGEAHLKVILETGELGTLDRIRLASDIAMEAGADFIKTSTGKIGQAANMEVTLVMLEAIRDFYWRTGKKIGMKPAGGIRTAKQAVHYLVMLRETLGPEWLTPDLFRFGASSLANDILMQVRKQKQGMYSNSEDFTKD